MMSRTLLAILLMGMGLTLPLSSYGDFATAHPRLFLSVADAASIAGAGALPTRFDQSLQLAREQVDQYLQQLPDVPVPKDAGGGYTHEQHKRNSVIIQNAGMLYLLTGNKAYADLAREILLAYAAMYPQLEEHPQKKEQTPGRLFWQSLNESVWLVTAVQGYDAIYSSLDAEARAELEQNLFRPMADFLSVQAPDTFDKIHNHGTWAVAAVGMTGYVLGEQDYVDKALYGLKKDGSGGFMRQLDELFSPDGYYSEGPYYQRYALMPFLLFAQAIDLNEPQRKIFEHRNGILLQAVDTVIQLSYDGYFFPFNDAIKDKGLDTIELCYGVAIAYDLTGRPEFLAIAEQQDQVVLTGAGFRMAQAMEAGLAQGSTPSFPFKSMLLLDGPQGEQGALAIFRSGPEAGQSVVVFKATAQGIGHGHFDRLGWLFYDNGHEIVSDYGAARFLNVEQKYGGHYLPENDTFAKQTVAHNTLVVDETSHFGGDWTLGEKIPTTPLLFASSEDIDISAAKITGAYDDVEFSRVMALLKVVALSQPAVLDVVTARSESSHQYDLPLYFQGHITNISHPVQANTTSMQPLGEQNGYQYLWNRASAEVAAGETFSLTWLKANRFYTYSVFADADMQVIFTETGANDPDFNLRREQGIVLRVKGASNYTFVSLLVPHGEYNGSREFTTASTSRIKSLQRSHDQGLDLVGITTLEGKSVVLGLSYQNDQSQVHQALFENKPYEWSGFFGLFTEP
jgi:hypothetical protein